MPRIFNSIRQRLLKENRLTRYLIYAAGEIVLVMVGILLALQVNTWNEQRKERHKEVDFLKGLKADLNADQLALEAIMKERNKKVQSSLALLDRPSLETYRDLRVVDSLIWNVFRWIRFAPQTNTMDELVGSGNLNVIKNDSIKSMMLELKQMQETDKIYTEHMRREYDYYLYDRHAMIRELGTFIDRKASFASGSSVQRPLSADELAEAARQADAFLTDRQVRNGLHLAANNNNQMIRRGRDMHDHINRLIGHIDYDIQRP